MAHQTSGLPRSQKGRIAKTAAHTRTREIRAHAHLHVPCRTLYHVYYAALYVYYAALCVYYAALYVYTRAGQRWPGGQGTRRYARSEANGNKREQNGLNIPVWLAG
jgi:hypothetical protein